MKDEYGTPVPRTRSANSLPDHPDPRWPRYEAATLGFRAYWHPAVMSRDLGRKPLSLKMLGERVLLQRSNGAVFALEDRCVHRGVPLSLGKCEFPGTISCPYHGWTYELATGKCVAVLTEGPDSPLTRFVRVRTYPVEERAGLVWVYMGGGTPPPLEDDVPQELLAPRAVVEGRVTDQRGNWRPAMENGVDLSHAAYLHKYSLWFLFRKLPAWSEAGVVQDGPWQHRTMSGKLGFEGHFPGLGTWPKPEWWRRSGRPAKLAVRLPETVRVEFFDYTHYELFVPIDEDHYRFFQLAVKWTSGLGAVLFRLKYWLWIHWTLHVQFNGQDMDIVPHWDFGGPEQLYAPDGPVVIWRKLANQARLDVDEVAADPQGASGRTAERLAEPTPPPPSLAHSGPSPREAR